MDKINPVSGVDRLRVHQVLSSQSLTNGQKLEFIKQNSAYVKEVLASDITKDEFKMIMNNRPLIRFRPLKNSFTKQGDDEILAKTMGINKREIRKTINSVIDNNFAIHDRQERDKIETLLPYVYRHGTKSQVVAFLEYELSDVKNTLEILYKTLDANTGGFAGYFNRPLHRMDNRTMRRIYKVVDKSLQTCEEGGYITSAQHRDAAEWALLHIYEIQNNSRLIRACHAYQVLTDM
ncbi:MAG: hypothetical protein NC191_03045 [Muribaculaceae bacterium]|nr:hypothetical protein [Muribaculaceae bacterium]